MKVRQRVICSFIIHNFVD